MSIYTILGWATTFCFNVSYIPQLLKIIRTKKVDDISAGYLSFLFAAYACGLIYSISIQAWPIVFSHAIGMSFSIFYFILYFKYRRVCHVSNHKRNRALPHR